MFLFISKFILRNRIPLLIVMGVVTLFFGYEATKIQLSYDFAKVLPETDKYFREYEKFKQQFGEDGSVLVIGVQDKDFFQLKKFNEWFTLGNEIKSIDGIEAVVSAANIYNITKNEEEKKFDLKPLVTHPLSSQQEVDSIKNILDHLVFYQGFLLNKETGATLMAITFDKKKLNTKNRIEIVSIIKEKALAFGKSNNLEIHLSGLPYIRTAVTQMVSSELKLFLVLALGVCSIILLVFFKNVRVVLFSILVVIAGVIWSLGTLSLTGFKITILSSLIPPLIIVIGIPNSIFFLNKYHTEYRLHRNKIKALQQMVQRVGLTTFLANVTTGIGFGVFYFTNSNILMEFGLIAAINVLSTYLISLILIPIVFSFLPAPSVKHTEHLEGKRISFLLEAIDKWVHRHTKVIYAVVIGLLLVSFYGMSKLNTVGYVVDDLPKKNPVYVDLKFFESNFHGVLPFEISIDAKEKGKALQHVTLQKINRLTKELNKHSEFAKPLSIVDIIKFVNQAYNDGDPKHYILPGSIELGQISEYIREMKSKQSMFRSFIDSTRQITRVSVQMADVGSVRMKQLVNELKPKIDSIFPPAKYETIITGNSLIFLKGNDYLFTNLMESVFLAIFLISIIMFFLFMSFRMIALSILPSIIPLFITAGLMGYFHIPLKPSTILIFSIAFGISSDGTIYFLTKYRQEMRHTHMSISKAVSLTIKETGVSMLYTAVILFAGFFIFTASSFGGTASLGVLISITLLVAMCSNLILLPAFLISLERKMTTKAFLKEPLLQFLNEDEDIELDNLEIKKNDDSVNSKQ